MKISIIGSGNIGGAIALGLGSSGVVNANDICCADLSAEVLKKLQALNPAIQTQYNNVRACENADIIIIAVKPWLVGSVIKEIKDALDYSRQIIVSIAAGIEIQTLCEYLNKGDNVVLPAVFRIIPNTAIAIRESVNFISSYNATQEQINSISEIFDALGMTFFVEERLMKAGTALASSGIAYSFRYIRAAIEGAIELGFYPALAQKIVIQTLKGAASLLEANGNHPEAEIDKVTTPGGITIKGLNAMEEAGFTNAVIKGLKASV